LRDNLKKGKMGISELISALNQVILSWVSTIIYFLIKEVAWNLVKVTRISVFLCNNIGRKLIILLNGSQTHLFL
jgi:hypothetical protein